jgi:hypothetical protein
MEDQTANDLDLEEGDAIEVLLERESQLYDNQYQADYPCCRGWWMVTPLYNFLLYTMSIAQRVCGGV